MSRNNARIEYQETRKATYLVAPIQDLPRDSKILRRRAPKPRSSLDIDKQRQLILIPITIALTLAISGFPSILTLSILLLLSLRRRWLLKFLRTAAEDPQFLGPVRVGVVQWHFEEQFCDRQFARDLVRGRRDEFGGPDGDFGGHCYFSWVLIFQLRGLFRVPCLAV